MSRPRSNILKVGDKVSYKAKEGVVVFVDYNHPKPYNVHFCPFGRGTFKFDDLIKIKPTFKAIELIDEDALAIKETIDGQEKI
jgi:hypothetical protein